VKKLVLALLLCLNGVAYSQPVPVTWRPPVTCSTNDFLKWSGTAWVCSGGAGVSGTGTNGTIVKWTPSGTQLGNSSITDTGTTVTSAAQNFKISSGAGLAPQIQFVQSGQTEWDIYQPSSTNKIAFFSNGADRFAMDTNGTHYLGDTANSSVQNNVDTLILGNTGVSQTSSTVLMNLTHSGSFDTTAGALNATGIQVLMTDTRSAGANSQSSFAVTASASGATTNNVAFRSNSGDNWFNVTGGNTVIGYASGSAPAIKFAVNGAEQIDGSSTHGNANTNTHTFTGATSITMSGSGNHALNTFYTGTGQTADRAAVNASNSGTFDSTASTRTGYGIIASSSAGRSAGANPVNATGLYANATAANGTAYSIYGDAGNVYLNATSGTTGIGTAPTTDQLTVAGATKVQTFKGTVLAPSSVSGTVNDWNPTNLATATTLIITPSASTTLTGIQGGTDGRRLNLCHSGAAFDVILKMNSGSSSAANRITDGWSDDHNMIASVGTCYELEYRSSDTSWHITDVFEFPDLYVSSNAVMYSDANLYALGGPNAPSATSCGTSPSVSGSGLAGIVTVGTGTATSCTVNYAAFSSTAPSCTVTSEANNGKPALLQRQEHNCVHGHDVGGDESRRTEV
jgi:hypothetical protein